MANTLIQLKYSTVTGNSPSSLANGELAINGADGRLFYSTPSGVVQYLQSFTGPSGLNKEVQFNDGGVLGANSQLTFDKATGTLTSKIFSGNVYVDATSYWTITSGDVFLAFDSNDYISYDRDTNTLNIFIGGVNEAYFDSNGLTLTNTLAVGSGGTGLSSPGTTGNVLTSNGTHWISSAVTGGSGIGIGKAIAMAMIFG